MKEESSVKSFKSGLKEKGLNIHQLEEVIDGNLNNAKTLFKVSPWEKKKYRNRFDKFFSELNNKTNTFEQTLKNLKDNLDDLDIDKLGDEEYEKKLTESFTNTAKLDETLKKIWTDNDKLIFSQIASKYFEFKSRRKLKLQVAKWITVNRFGKIVITALLLYSSFLVSFYISPHLEYLFSSNGEFYSSLLSTLVIYLTFDQLFAVLETHLRYWRVKKLLVPHYEIMQLVNFTKQKFGL